MVARAFEADSLLSLIVGPMVWTVHFLTVYCFAAVACAHGFFHTEVLGVRIVLFVGGIATLIAIVLIVDALATSFRRWRDPDLDRRPGPLPRQDLSDLHSRRRFMAYAGILLSGAALIAIVFESLPLIFFATCR
jgi:hypothetical protein